MNRTQRRQFKRANPAKPDPGTAYFCTALDGRVHVTQGGLTKTLCGRAARQLPDDASNRKNRCPTCAARLA